MANWLDPSTTLPAGPPLVNPLVSDPLVSQLAQAPPAPPRGMFGGGKFGIAQAIVAALNGYLASTRGPAQQVGVNNLQMMADQRQRLLEHQQSLDDYNRRRADDNTDFQAHRQYDIANPLPQQPDELESALIASGVQPGTPQWAQAMQTRAQNMLDPAVVTPQGMMLRSQITGAIRGASPPPQPGEVQDGYRFKGGNPADPNAWEATGGPTPQASGNFPGR